MSDKKYSGKILPLREQKERYSVQSLARCSDDTARSYLPFEVARRLVALPLGVIGVQNRRILTIGVGGPVTPALHKELRFVCGIDVKLVQFEADLLAEAVFISYKGNDYSLAASAEKLTVSSSSLPLPVMPEQKFGFRDGKGEVNDFLEVLISYAVRKKASDIHLEPKSSGLFVKLRIDGELLTHSKSICDAGIYRKIVNRIKILSSLDITISSRTQEGAMTFNLDKRSLSIRVSIMPTIDGEKIVLRLHGIHEFRLLEDLGLSGSTQEYLLKAIDEMSGIVICSGTTGSGKTTTLYALLEKISKRNASIITVEDPVEIKVDFASQTSVDVARNFSFAEALKASLRQDPDCIMIGEIRDRESAAIAFNAALTGHLVLCSVHAGTAKGTIQRILDFGVSKTNFSQSCKVIICHELKKRLCEQCRNGTSECTACESSGYQGLCLSTDTIFFDLPREVEEEFEPWLQRVLKHNEAIAVGE